MKKEEPLIQLSRRRFIAKSRWIAALTVFVQLPSLLKQKGWALAAEPEPDIFVRDTLLGLLAFVVPGHDVYSVAQGVSMPEAGGPDAGVLDALISTLDLSQPFPEPIPPFSATVATVLNGFALAVNPNSTGSFISPFARLTFAEKATVFAFMEGDPSPEAEPLRVLGGLLPGLVAFLVYSEAGVYDPESGTVSATPLGWSLSGYAGVSNGWNEFKGYLGNRKQAEAGGYHA